MFITVDQPITTENHYKICFVCLGNICRSPTAEGVFQHLVNERGLEAYFEVDSAGTSAYHSGQSANRHSQSTANRNGITLHSKARQLKTFDLDYFDMIVAMDNQNLANINQLVSGDGHGQKVRQLREFDPEPEHGEVPDPYAGGQKGFENVFRIVKRSCEHLLDELETHIK
ncbi:MAG TPA: low molecular weight protein-tyrosine-phosphatase [Balneolaceae bacterium]